jgi:flagellum-specific ATP synthase
VSVDLAPARARLRALDPYRLNGRVSELIGLVVESRGPEASVGERCEILLPGHRAGRPPLQAEVVGFREGRTLLMPLGDAAGIGPGQTVVASGGAVRVDLGTGLLGRVLAGRSTPRRPTCSVAPPSARRSPSASGPSTR